MTDIDKTIEEHRKMIVLSKNISEFHLNNIKAWIYIFFNDVKEATIEYDFLDSAGNFGAGQVIVKLNIGNKAIQTKQGYDNFIEAVKYILFKETKVILYKNGRLWKFKNTPTILAKKKKKLSKTTSKTDAQA
jgi:hypothetical protein